jgi:hypothetical protein
MRSADAMVSGIEPRLAMCFLPRSALGPTGSGEAYLKAPIGSAEADEHPSGKLNPQIALCASTFH